MKQGKYQDFIFPHFLDIVTDMDDKVVEIGEGGENLDHFEFDDCREVLGSTSSIEATRRVLVSKQMIFPQLEMKRLV